MVFRHWWRTRGETTQKFAQAEAYVRAAAEQSLTRSELQDARHIGREEMRLVMQRELTAVSEASGHLTCQLNRSRAESVATEKVMRLALAEAELQAVKGGLSVPKE